MLKCDLFWGGILIDAEKAFSQIQLPFMIFKKTSQQSGNRRIMLVWRTKMATYVDTLRLLAQPELTEN